jgi:hypothetical protein
MRERTPIWDAHARAVAFGLSLDHGRGHSPLPFQLRRACGRRGYSWRGGGLLKSFHVVMGLAQAGDKSILNPENHARYMKLSAVFRSLHPALKNQCQALAEASQ